MKWPIKVRSTLCCHDVTRTLSQALHRDGFNLNKKRLLINVLCIPASTDSNKPTAWVSILAGACFLQPRPVFGEPSVWEWRAARQAGLRCRRGAWRYFLDCVPINWQPTWRGNLVSTLPDELMIRRFPHCRSLAAQRSPKKPVFMLRRPFRIAPQS